MRQKYSVDMPHDNDYKLDIPEFTRTDDTSIRNEIRGIKQVPVEIERIGKKRNN